MFDYLGYTKEEWQQYMADYRASYTEKWSKEDSRYWDENDLGRRDDETTRKRVEFFKERRAREDKAG